MGNPYESSRHQFNKVLDAYLSYVSLYKLFNNGDVKGVTPFNVFYWRMTYLVRYDNSDSLTRPG